MIFLVWFSIVLFVEAKRFDQIVFHQITQTVVEGDDLYLICQGRLRIAHQIVWEKNGHRQFHSSRIIDLENGSTRMIKSVDLSDEGEYKCIMLSNERKHKILSSVVGSVKIRKRIPSKIIYRPSDQVVLSGGHVRLPCIVQGNDYARILWSISTNDGRSILSLSVTPHHLIETRVIKNRLLMEPTRLVIVDAMKSDSGVYECIVEDHKGRIIDRASARLLVDDIVDLTELRKEVSALSDFLRQVKAQQKVREQRAKEETLRVNQFARSPMDMIRFFRQPNAKSREMDKRYQRFELAIEKILENHLTVNSSSPVITEALLHEIGLDTDCLNVLPTPTCFRNVNNEFRTFNGSCNNLRHPTWGMLNTPFRRMLQPIYEDGFHLPVGFDPNLRYFGHPKPSARSVSVHVMSTPTLHSHPIVTDLHNHWGQFIDHDMDFTPSSFVDSGFLTGESCFRTCKIDLPCYPISLPKDEPRITNPQCIPFSRSGAACFNNDGGLSPRNTPTPRNQINQISAYLDGSVLYGSDEIIANALRDLTTNEGLLKVGIRINGYEYLTQENSTRIFCTLQPTDPFNCFFAGELRANEQLIITVLTTIFFREHNRIARELANINPHWLKQTNRIYFETRKIIGSLLQHITYEHWLPHLIGLRGMMELGEYRGYQANVDASISNVFATAAFRHGHGINQGVLFRVEDNGDEIRVGHLALRHAFFAPGRLIREGGLEPLIRGTARYPAKLMNANQPADPEITEHLFETTPNGGLDLISLDIQRGRDHALPAYNDWRAACGFNWANTFDELADDIPVESARQKLEKMYGHPGNIDAEVGMILEKPRDGAQMGPTSRCILVNQFRRTRDGDRFFYRNKDVFTSSQLREIEKMSLARVLCNVGDGIRQSQQDVFRIPLPNDIQSCRAIPNMNLNAWREFPSTNG